jgi:tetratricopeptide (TPR) repeat protein
MAKKISELVEDAKSLAKEKLYSESAEAFRSAFKDSPHNPEALRELAMVMRDLGQSQLALSLLADSTSTEAPDVPTLRQISLILRAQNRMDEAADFLICALAHDSENEELFDETLMLLKQLGRESELVAGASEPAPE